MSTFQHARGTSPTQDRDSRSIADLLRELRDEASQMFRQEINLAKVEMTDKASKVGRNAAFIAAGGLVALIGAGFLLYALSYGIRVLLDMAGVSENVYVWLAPLIVGLIVAGVGYALVQKGLSTLKHESAVPRETVRSLQENKQWLKHRMT